MRLSYVTTLEWCSVVVMGMALAVSDLDVVWGGWYCLILCFAFRLWNRGEGAH